MAYTVLYRKLRPLTFHEVVGQEAIVRTLTNQIKSERLSHAYLFTGTRGTGKTSTAKIFARAINCLHSVEGNPCNQCENCRRELDGNDLNILEIDAASNNGVDDIRELREDVRYQPSGAKYKVYIIDEVHMLSTSAFNALLKTLEEPPAHVVFILATTDPHKIPETILSRCQRYDFRRISNENIRRVMQNYLEKEGIAYEEKAIRWIAKAADGALRDAHSILDRCLSFYLGEEITLEKVLKLMGAVDTGVYESLTASLIRSDINALLEQTDEIVMQGRDLEQLILGEISFLRDILICKTMPNPEQILDLPEETLVAFKSVAGLRKEEFFVYVIKELSKLEAEMKYQTNKRILLELAWIKLCHPEVEKGEDSIPARLEAIEKKLAEGIVAAPQPAVQKASTEGQKPASNLPPLDTTSFPKDIKSIIAQWKDLVFKEDPLLNIILNRATPFYDEKRNSLMMVVEDTMNVRHVNFDENLKMLSDFLRQHFNQELAIEVLSIEDYEKKHSRSIGEVRSAVESLRQNIDFDIEVKE